MPAHRSASHRTRVALSAVTMAAGATLAPAGAAHADAVVDHFQIVAVTGTSTTRDGCLVTTASVSAIREEFDNFLFYSRQVVDECTGAQISYVQGAATPTVFEAAPSQRSVHVVGEVPLEDPFTDLLTGEVVVIDTTWTARGRAQTTTEHFRFAVPGETRTIQNLRASTVDAAVSGAVPFRDGEIGRLASRFVVITHT